MMCTAMNLERLETRTVSRDMQQYSTGRDARWADRNETFQFGASTCQVGREHGATTTARFALALAVWSERDETAQDLRQTASTGGDKGGTIAEARKPCGYIYIPEAVPVPNRRTLVVQGSKNSYSNVTGLTEE